MSELPLYVRMAVAKGVIQMMRQFEIELDEYESSSSHSLDYAKDQFTEIVGVFDYMRTHQGFHSYDRLLGMFEPLYKRYLALEESLKTE
ncbi:hypothetical protein [Aneurinibacillus aneurinilyticus]|jgi:membrane-bound lytic murein transglycosylase MltF|uniref:hypothetical protein n=1 Tax=Aneurinibacillus aneurinilyticus TaxID=1391 RepID=UPI0023F669EC|nr:hypothetical protein [Aneurinibacillus aneurinilyticus]MCI1696276.1 hypothetical protein [Aneurinibacillus aneurinilyticus]